MNRSALKKIATAFGGPMSLAKACVISTCFHAFLLGPFNMEKARDNPVVFDIVIIDSGHDQGGTMGTAEELRDEAAAQVAQMSESTPSLETTAPADIAAGLSDVRGQLPQEEHVPREERKVGEEKDRFRSIASRGADEVISSDYMDYLRGDIEVEGAHFIGSSPSHSIAIPRLLRIEPRLSAARVPLSEKQQRYLSRQISKLINNLHNIDPSDSLMYLKQEGRIYEVTIQRQSSGTVSGLDSVILKVRTEDNGHILTTEIMARQLAFSSFAQLVDQWDPEVAVHDDMFNGRFHTNSTLTISGSRGILPRFCGRVTTASFDVKTGDGFPFFVSDSVFLAGFEYGVREIRLPREFTFFANQIAGDTALSHYLTENTWIHFHDDGSYTWKSGFDLDFEHRKVIPADIFYILGSEIDVHLRGVVKGKVLVYSAGNVIIDDDVTYYRHPESWGGSADYLGLIAQNSVEIANPEVTGPGDLHIFAAVYAMKRFKVNDLRNENRGTLHLYGSLTAGSLTATEPRYATRIHFDRRFERSRPPHFPLTERYEIIEWNKMWRIAPSG